MLKVFLVWLVMLTLPLQGVSAALMPLHVAHPVEVAATGAGMTGVSMAAGCHGIQADPSGKAGDMGHVPAVPSKAKACSACCLGVGLDFAGNLSVAPHPGRDAYLPHHILGAPDFIADGPERPPRGLPA